MAMSDDARKIWQTPGGVRLLKSMLAGTADETVKTDAEQARALALLMEKTQAAKDGAKPD